MGQNDARLNLNINIRNKTSFNVQVIFLYRLMERRTLWNMGNHDIKDILD